LISLFDSFFTSSVKQRRREPMGGLLRVCAAASVFLCVLFFPIDAYAKSYAAADLYIVNVYQSKQEAVEYGYDGTTFVCRYDVHGSGAIRITDITDLATGIYGGYFRVNITASVNDVFTKVKQLNVTWQDGTTSTYYPDSYNAAQKISRIYVSNFDGAFMGTSGYIAEIECVLESVVYVYPSPVDTGSGVPKADVSIAYEFGLSNWYPMYEGNINKDEVIIEGIDDLNAGLSDNTDAIDRNTGAVQDFQQQQQYHWDMDENAANQAGSDMEGFAQDLEGDIRSKWEILWFPIEFTESVMSAFQGSSTQLYSTKYADVSGYRYNNETGTLEPVYMKSRGVTDIPTVANGTYITFPAYTLPVLNVKVWDDYSFDLAFVKEQIPVIFEALYVICFILETFWFVSFLHNKFMEVFAR